MSATEDQGPVSPIATTSEAGSGPLDATASPDEVRRAYNAFAAVYDLWGRLAETRPRQRALELAAISDGEGVLEVAVGTGLAFYQIVKANPHGHNVGIDIAERMLARTRQRLCSLRTGRYQLLQASASQIPLADRTVDVLLNGYMFDLIPFAGMGRILAEFLRVLKPDGRLVLVDMTPGESLVGSIFDRMANLSPRLMGGCRSVQMTGILSANGFQVLVREYMEQLFFPSEIILAKRQD